MTMMPDSLPDDAGALKALVIAAGVENERLIAIIKELRRPSFRPAFGENRSGPTGPDAGGRRTIDCRRRGGGGSPRVTETGQGAAARKRRINRGALPKDLPREDVVIDLADKNCPCCGGLRIKIGEDASERLDMIPARFRVIVTRRPKYACRACEGEVAQAPTPERLIESGVPTEGLVAAVVIAKYADHLPLYRQVQIYARQGVELDRSTLADWSGRAAFALRPVHERLFEILKESVKLFADETRAPVLDPGRRKTKTGQLSAYARDNRPWGDPEPPGVAYVYEPDRKHERPAVHLSGFGGILQVYGYGAYKALADKGQARLAFCWAHVRRKFFEIQAATPAPIAAEALARIGALYAVEREIRGLSADSRRSARHARAKSILEAMKPWLEAKLAAVSGKSTIAEAIRYALSRWAGLTRYLDDGRIEIDNNVVERAMRPIALGRKNHLFAGSDEGGRHWAVHASLIETAAQATSAKFNRLCSRKCRRQFTTFRSIRRKPPVVKFDPRGSAKWRIKRPNTSLVQTRTRKSARLRLCPQTTSAPRRQASTKSITVFGGSCRSAESITTASPSLMIEPRRFRGVTPEIAG